MVWVNDKAYDKSQVQRTRVKYDDFHIFLCNRKRNFFFHCFFFIFIKDAERHLPPSLFFLTPPLELVNRNAYVWKLRGNDGRMKGDRVSGHMTCCRPLWSLCRCKEDNCVSSQLSCLTTNRLNYFFKKLFWSAAKGLKAREALGRWH